MAVQRNARRTSCKTRNSEHRLVGCTFGGRTRLAGHERPYSDELQSRLYAKSHFSRFEYCRSGTPTRIRSASPTRVQDVARTDEHFWTASRHAHSSSARTTGTVATFSTAIYRSSYLWLSKLSGSWTSRSGWCTFAQEKHTQLSYTRLWKSLWENFTFESAFTMAYRWTSVRMQLVVLRQTIH